MVESNDMTNITTLIEYQDDDGNSPFADWFNGLDARAALKVNIYITRVGNGNYSNVKSIGSGVHECKINWATGYRVYFGKDGDKWIVLLGGGTKKRQSHDIELAKQCWQDYKKQG